MKGIKNNIFFIPSSKRGLGRFTSNFTTIIIIALSLFSCVKDIDIELPESDKKLVVEGSIEQGQPPFVILTKSEGYFDPIGENFLQNLYVHDATIFVSNGTDNIQLTEICLDDTSSLLPIVAELTNISLADLKAAGICVYSTINPLIFGEIGKTYTLTIDADGKSVSSTTTIPTPVVMDRFYYKDQPGFSDLGYLWFELNDPPELGNAYRIYTKRENVDSRFIPAEGSVFDDQFVNGLKFEAFIFRGFDPNGQTIEEDEELTKYFRQGDKIIIKFCSIDQPHFQFWNSFEVAAFNNGNPFAAPSTIRTNIEGGLGVWGGYGVTYDTLVAVD